MCSRRTAQLLAFTTLIFSAFGPASAQSTPRSTEEPIKIKIVKQKGTPLSITRARTFLNDEGVTSLQYDYENTGDKPILAASLVLQSNNGALQIEDVFFGSIVTSNASAKRGDGIDFTVSRRVTMWVDLVLFADGSHWGKDEYEEYQTLVGYARGLNDAALAVLSVMADAEKLKLLFASSCPSLSEIVGRTGTRSNKWALGYQVGYRSLVEQIAAQKTSDPDQLVKTLSNLAASVQKD